MEVYTEKKTCRLCGVSLPREILLSLGNQCISAFVYTDLDPITAPLDLVLCPNCNLLQLKHTTNPSILYTDNYGYRTGLNSTMKKEVKDIVDSILSFKHLKKNDIVVDIGSNDATLLKNYPKNITKVGFEPVKKFRHNHNMSSVFYIGEFFNADSYKQIFLENKVKVITAISMFYDLEDPNFFLKDVIEILDDDGILVIQQNYLPKMLAGGMFDNICHEHVAYYSLTTLQKLLNSHGLEVFEVFETPINGGSFRAFVGFKGKRGYSVAVDRILHSESDQQLDNPLVYRRFAEKVEKNVSNLKEFIVREKAKGKKFWAYAASTRGNVLLQAAGLAYPMIEGCSERNPEKWGKKTLGTNIPIYSEEDARIAKPDYFLVLPYWFRDEFIAREREYLEAGGALVFPLPELKVIRKEVNND